MAGRKVLILGASVRAAAESAARAGLGVVASDMFGDVDLLDVAEFVPIEDYPDGFASVIAEYPGLPVLYTGGLENHPELLELPRLVLGNRGSALRDSRDVFGWSQLLRDRGFQVAELRPWNDRPEPPCRWLAKSLRSAGGGGVRFVESDVAIESGSFFQERITGPTIAAVFLANDAGATLFDVTSQLTGLPSLNTPPFGYCGSVGPIDIGEAAMKVVCAAGDVFVSEMGLRGVFGIDFVVSDDSVPIPVEINPRYTASVEVIELALGKSAFAGVFSSAEPVVEEATAPRFVIKLVVYAPTNLTVGSLPRRLPTDRAWLSDIPQPGTSVGEGDPVCCVLATGFGRNEAMAALAVQLERLADHVPVSPDAVLSDVADAGGA